MYPCHQNGTFPKHFSSANKVSWIQTYSTICILLLLVQDLASTPTTHEIPRSGPELLDKKPCCITDNESSCCHRIREGTGKITKRNNQVTTSSANQVTVLKNLVTVPANNAEINMTKSELNTQCRTTHEVHGRKDSVESAATQRQVYIPFDRGIKVKPSFGHRGERSGHKFTKQVLNRTRRQPFDRTRRQVLDIHRDRTRRQVFIRPVFLQPQNGEQKVFINTEAFLDCRVRNLGQHTVSWIRQRDLQILSVGRHLFTTDKRLSLTYEPREQNYRLEIRQVRREDFGLYECQINTKPMQTITMHIKQKSIPIVPTHKTVKATTASPEVNELGEAMDPPEMSGAKTDILGGPDIYVHPNSLVNITCVVLASSKPNHIFWSHEGQGLTYSSRAGVSIILEDKGQTMVSQLLLRSVSPSDQGTYQCKPDNHLPAEARLFIIEDAVSDATRVNSASMFPPWPKVYSVLILVVSRTQISNG